MDPVIVDSGATPVTNFLQSINAKPKFDARYRSSIYESAFKENAITPSTRIVRFKLDALKGGSRYDISDVIVEGRIRLCKNDLTPLDDNEAVSVVNNVLFSAFKSIRCYVNSKLVLDLSSNQLYQYWMTKLNYYRNAQDTFLSTQGFVDDSVDAYEDPNNNIGWQKRRNFFGKMVGEAFKYYAKPTVFVGQLLNYLPDIPLLPAATVYYEFEIASNESFLLCSDNIDARFVLDDLSLKVRKNFYWDSYYNGLLNTIADHKLTKHFRKMAFTSFNIPAGSNNFFWNLPALGQSISKLFIFLQNSKNTVGRKSKNLFYFPVNFNQSSITKLELLLNSQPLDGLSGNNDDNKLNYLKIFKFLGQMQGENCSSITYDEYISSSYFHFYDYSASLTETPLYMSPLLRTGSSRIEITFSENLDYDLTATIFVEIPSSICIDKSGIVEVGVE